MPFSIQPGHLFTIRELESQLNALGDLSPKRTIRRLVRAGMVIRAGKLVIGQDLLAALENCGDARGLHLTSGDNKQ